MSLATRAYAQSPPWMQSLLISAYGVKLRRERYGPVGRATLERLRRSQWLSPAEVRRSELAALTQRVSDAARDVPFYRDAGLTPIAFRSFEQLRDLPLLTKAQVQRAGRALVSDGYAARRLSEVHTGGTTGTPLAIYCDSATLQRNYAFFTRFRENAGVPASGRTATFAGRVLVPPGGGAPYWRRNHAANTLLFSSYHIGPDTADAYVRALAEFAPALIDSYPSSLEPLARHIVSRGITSVRPAAVITSSETLFPEVRALLERAFGCRVYDHYGSAEMAALITQCDAGRYHVVPEFGVVELLDDGRPVSPGERGEIVATGFINPVMPLIRYATGDSAVLGEGPCPCGRPGRILERIEGRMDDVIVTPEGHRVGRLDPVFKAVAALHETRIVQDAPDHVRVETVVSGALADGVRRELVNQLQARLGRAMRIDIVPVPRLERTGRGKLRTTVNLVHGRAREPVGTDA